MRKNESKTKSDTGEEETIMSRVITISREFGSGGREVGFRLAEKLGIPFYDKEIISMAAEDTNISEDVFHRPSPRLSKNWLRRAHASSSDAVRIFWWKMDSMYSSAPA